MAWAHRAASRANIRRGICAAGQIRSAATWHSRIKRGDTVYVGMSGGVDSSVAAHLVQAHAHVEAIYMCNWDTRDERGECPSSRDWRDVQRVCAQLHIKCHRLDLVKAYWNRVFSVALDDFACGRTPNPDVLCNSQIKFGVLLDEIDRRLRASSAWFATGHYARVAGGPSAASLHRGVDRSKDQSYYLSGVSGRRLNRAVFPLGGLTKARDVRRIARELGLATAEKAESMGICFVGERRRFDRFLAEYLPQQTGDVLAYDGRRIGRHGGLFTRTIGQSAGIAGMGEKWYVYAKDPAANCMYAVPGRDHPLLHTRNVAAGPAHWISGSAPEFGPNNRLELAAQIRYMQQPQPCVVSSHSDHICVRFDSPQFGIASGQYLALYRGDQCLGSAQIRTTNDTSSL
ncbi:hypothetical protein H4S02_008598 [Coemansia sp. RSA 2611]|nr:hypothetical protein H4S02_008598 [Coemansia sp. RSA 2611]